MQGMPCQHISSSPIIVSLCSLHLSDTRGIKQCHFLKVELRRHRHTSILHINAKNAWYECQCILGYALSQAIIHLLKFYSKVKKKKKMLI